MIGLVSKGKGVPCNDNVKCIWFTVYDTKYIVYYTLYTGWMIGLVGKSNMVLRAMINVKYIIQYTLHIQVG